MIQVIQGSLRCPAGRWWWVRLQHLDTRRHRRCSPYPGVSESPRNMGNMYCWYVDINNLDIHGEIFMENLEHDGDSVGIFQAFCSKIPSPLANNDEPMMGSWIHTLVIFTELSPSNCRVGAESTWPTGSFCFGENCWNSPVERGMVQKLQLLRFSLIL